MDRTLRAELWLEFGQLLASTDQMAADHGGAGSVAEVTMDFGSLKLGSEVVEDMVRNW